MKEIRLQYQQDNRGRTIVAAKWLDGDQPDSEIVGLFGTHIILTPFSDIALAYDEVKALNPDRLVSVV